MRTTTAVYVRAHVTDGLLHCGRCNSADYWLDTPTDVGGTNCGALLPHDQHELAYADLD
jgi:hypothetical protein